MGTDDFGRITGANVYGSKEVQSGIVWVWVITGKPFGESRVHPTQPWRGDHLEGMQEGNYSFSERETHVTESKTRSERLRVETVWGRRVWGFMASMSKSEYSTLFDLTLKTVSVPVEFQKRRTLNLQTKGLWWTIMSPPGKQLFANNFTLVDHQSVFRNISLIMKIRLSESKARPSLCLCSSGLKGSRCLRVAADCLFSSLRTLQLHRESLHVMGTPRYGSSSHLVTLDPWPELPISWGRPRRRSFTRRHARLFLWAAPQVLVKTGG